MRVTFDIETNKLKSFHTLEGLGTLHCVALSVDGGPVQLFAGDKLGEALDILSGADELEHFNGDRFDIPALRKLTSRRFTFAKSRDLLVCAKVLWPTEDLKSWDYERIDKGHSFPSRLIGRHSLKAWGYRLGVLKGDFGDENQTWEKYTPEMGEYCKQDVEVTKVLSRYIDSFMLDEAALDLEHRFARILWDQERHGFAFDGEAAEDLLSGLERKRAALKDELCNLFPPFVDTKVSPVKKLVRVVETPFNPNSRHHIARAFKDKYNWKPRKWTPSGQPQVDEAVLKDLPYPEAKKLTEALMVQKRIGQLAEGSQAWLKKAKADGRIHGRVDHNGAGTNRCTHQSPNMTAVPKVGKPIPCRHLFVARHGPFRN